MKILIIFTVLISPIFSSFPTQIQRRQFLSYTNNVVHENPKYPDQTAQSSVKVNFHQPSTSEVRQAVYTGTTLQQTKPQEFPQPSYTQSFVTNAPESQLFNVGYSVTFTNGNKPQPRTKYPRKSNLEEAEIITGTRKQNEEVAKPGINLSPQEFVSNAYNKKKQKYSNYHVAAPSNPKGLLLTANTQKFYKALEQAKPQLQNSQDLQQKYSWRNLSPGVEIIRSTELPAQKFDHGRALGRSQEFDFTNALDNQSQQPQVFYNTNQPFEQISQIDMSLLKEPIMVQVDTRYLNENPAVFYNAQNHQDQTVQDVNYLKQNYKTIQNPAQVVYQQEPTQNYQDFLIPDQKRFEMKIYGKPQPLQVGFNDNEQFKRQPRYSGNLHTKLRPPPLEVPYQRVIRFA